MYAIAAACEISSSHATPGVDGRPGPVHGHNFRVVAHVESDRLDGGGRVLPPGALRADLWVVLEPIDHRHLNDLPEFAGLVPTPAVLARWVAERLAPRLAGRPHLRLRRVEVWPDALTSHAWEPPQA